MELRGSLQLDKTHVLGVNHNPGKPAPKTVINLASECDVQVADALGIRDIVYNSINNVRQGLGEIKSTVALKDVYAEIPLANGFMSLSPYLASNFKIVQTKKGDAVLRFSLYTQNEMENADELLRRWNSSEFRMVIRPRQGELFEVAETNRASSRKAGKDAASGEREEDEADGPEQTVDDIEREQIEQAFGDGETGDQGSLDSVAGCDKRERTLATVQAGLYVTATLNGFISSYSISMTRRDRAVAPSLTGLNEAYASKRQALGKAALQLESEIASWRSEKRTGFTADEKADLATLQSWARDWRDPLEDAMQEAVAALGD